MAIKPASVETKTKRKILDAAEQLFANEGYRGASVKMIATKAGVTGAMINYYFKNKESLYFAVLDRIVDDISKMVTDIVATGLPPAERLELFVSWYFDYAAQHPNFTRLTRMGLGGPEKEHFEQIIPRFFKPLFEVGVKFLSEELKVKAKYEIDYRHLLLAVYGATVYYFTDSDFMAMVLGKSAMSKKELEKRKDTLQEIIFRTLGIKRPSQNKSRAKKQRNSV